MRNAEKRCVGPRFGDVNDALQQFVAELKAQGIFDNVVIVTHSDFARTLTPNSNAGTDHGWSGIQMASWKMKCFEVCTCDFLIFLT